MARFLNIAAYKFVRLDRLVERRERLREHCQRLDLRGTILLAGEGINLFLAGEEAQVDQFVETLHQEAEFADLEIKRSFSEHQPFRRMLVRLKQEIIAFGVDGIDPSQRTSPKMPATELRQWIEEGRDFTLLDVRNDYEVEVGTFAGATPAKVDHFRDFPDAVKQFPEQWKSKPLVMFCTGGIRCEKAGPLMEQEGYEQVFQLDGGILRYFEECGGDHYQGDCFVFDHRVALDPQLEETSDVLCFACQSIVTAEQQDSPYYISGVSCPNCYRTDEQQRAAMVQARNEVIRAATTPLPGSAPYDNVRPLKVSQKFDGWRLIDVLDAAIPFLGRDAWVRECEAGRVSRDDVPLTAETVMRGGERIHHVESNVVEPDVNPAIEVVYEDESIVAVNKPAPLPMHPCGRFNRNTLIEILNTVYAPERIRVGHRLDANTSGLVVLSRRRSVASQLQPQFIDGGVRKTYLALAQGRFEQAEFSCDAPIRAEALEAGLRAVDEDDGLAAETRFRVLRTAGDKTLLEVQPITGRTNQIRIHLWWLGAPIVGDPSYLLDRQLGKTQTQTPESPPMCLHAWKLEFEHPTSGRRMELATATPPWAAAFSDE